MTLTTLPAAHKANSYRAKSAAYVDYIIQCCQANNGARAALKRADNPATEYQSWEILAGFSINLEIENQRLPYATIGAALARKKITENGTITIGQAIARCYEDGNNSDQAKAKLRRLLACDSASEACRILRPLLSLIEAKAGINLNYAGLLDDLLWFDYEDRKNQIKAHWAQQFYGKPVKGGNDE